jgi:membrane-associated protein
LLFAAGAVAAVGDLRVTGLFLLLSLAAFLGNITNYWIGREIGPAVFKKERSRFFKQEYLDKTHRFYEKYGSVTIVIARFMPVIRTVAPFVAGIGRMTYLKFVAYSLVGSISWVALFLFGGYFFGSLPVVKRNFSLVVIGVIMVSLVPAFIAYLRNRRAGIQNP